MNKKNILQVEVCEALNIFSSTLSLNLTGYSKNLQLLESVESFVDAYDERFVNIRPKLMTKKGLKGLGFSQWEISQLLCD